MNAFDKMYNSTLRYLKVYDDTQDDTQYDTQENNKKGGFIDTNSYIPNVTNSIERDYSRMDPVAIYRNNKSLKNVPYDVNKVKFLYERTHPASERFDSFIKKAQNKASIDTKRYNNFLNWINNDLRRLFWKERCPTGVQRFRHTDEFADIDNLFGLIDFDNRIVYRYVYYQEGVYKIIGSTATHDSYTAKSGIKQSVVNKIKQLRKSKTEQRFIIDYKNDENAFFETPKYESIFMNPQEHDIIERGNIQIVHISKGNYKNLLDTRDITLMPELTGPAKQAYMDYVTREEENIQKSIPQEAKAELEQTGVLTPEEEKKIEETQV